MLRNPDLLPSGSTLLAPDPSPVTLQRDRDGLLAVLDVIERTGWDSPTGESLLQYVRKTVVRPAVGSVGIRGSAADQAEASAWSATWEAMTGPNLRRAESPWGVLWATARRAALGEAVAGDFGTGTRKAWRALASADAAIARSTGTEARSPAIGVGLVSLDALADAGYEPADPTPDGTCSGAHLSAVALALVGEGWSEPVARRTIDEIAAVVDLDDRGRVWPQGWRELAVHLGLPPWQVRRVAIVLLGAQGWPGLLERLVLEGPDVLTDPPMLAALRSTTLWWLPNPITAAERAERRTRRSSRKAA